MSSSRTTAGPRSPGRRVARAVGERSHRDDHARSRTSPKARPTGSRSSGREPVCSISANHGMASHDDAGDGLLDRGRHQRSDRSPPSPSTGVGSTTATITWTTSESADGQAFYRSERNDDLSTVVARLHDGHEPHHRARRAGDPVDDVRTPTTCASSDAAGTLPYLDAGHDVRHDRERVHAPPLRGRGGNDSRADALHQRRGGQLRQRLHRHPSGTPTGSATAPSGTATFGVNIPTAGTFKLGTRRTVPTRTATRCVRIGERRGARADRRPPSPASGSGAAGR